MNFAVSGRSRSSMSGPTANTAEVIDRLAVIERSPLALHSEPLPGDEIRVRLTFRALRAAYEVNLRVNWRLQALGRPLGIHVDERPLVSERYSQELGPSALTFHWGVNRLRSRYAETAG